MIEKAIRITTNNMFIDLGPGYAKELKSRVALGPAFKRQINTNVPPSFPDKLIAVWDTGATGTTITRDLAQRLQLDEIGEVEIHGVTGSEICRRFLVSLHLPNRVIIPELEVTDCAGDIGCEVLIGMDVISLGDFAVSNFLGGTTFTFRIPSVERIDFTKQLASDAIGGRFITPPKLKRNDPCPCGSGKKYKKCCGSPMSK